MATRNELKLRFKTGSIPKEEDFAEWMDSIAFQQEDGMVKSRSGPLEIRVEGQTSGEVIRFFSINNKQENRLRFNIGVEEGDDDSKVEFSKFEIIGNDNFGVKFRHRSFRFVTADISEIEQVFHQSDVSDLDISDLPYMGVSNDNLRIKSWIASGLAKETGKITHQLYIKNLIGDSSQVIDLMGVPSTNQSDSSSSMSFRISGIKKINKINYGESTALEIEQKLLKFSIDPATGSVRKMFEITYDAVKAYGTIQPIGTADFAELFESENKKRIPVGVSIVITEKGFIRPAKKGEVPTGIISSAPGILGGNHDEWPNKYLKDEFGALVYEEADVEESLERGLPGQTFNIEQHKTGEVKRIRRAKLNPDYDPNREYIPRSQRPEWHPVGLLGQLHLRKGQPVAPTWVKIKDVSENVELWLVK